MYGNQLPQTGFNVLIFAVVGLLSLAGGALTKALKRR